MPGWSVRSILADRQALVHVAGHRGLIVLALFEGPEAWSRPRKSANYLTWDEVEGGGRWRPRLDPQVCKSATREGRDVQGGRLMLLIKDSRRRVQLLVEGRSPILRPGKSRPASRASLMHPNTHPTTP